MKINNFVFLICMLALTSLGAQSKTTTTPIQIKATVVVDTPKPLIDTDGKLKELTKT